MLQLWKYNYAHSDIHIVLIKLTDKVHFWVFIKFAKPHNMNEFGATLYTQNLYMHTYIHKHISKEIQNCIIYQFVDVIYQPIEQKFKLTSQISQYLWWHITEVNEHSCGKLVFHKTGVCMWAYSSARLPKTKGTWGVRVCY